MKILMINTLYTPNIVGGAERSVQFLAEAMVQDGQEVVVVCTSPDQGMHVSWVNGVKVYYIGLKNLFWPFKDKDNPTILKPFWHMMDSFNPFMVREVDKIIAEECPDIVHTNNLAGFSTYVWKVIKKRGLPIIHTLRDYYLLCPRSSMFRKEKNCSSQCLDCKPFTIPRQQNAKLVDVVIGNSHFILNRHLELNFFNNARERSVIYNAYKANNTHDSGISKKEDRLKFGYLGRLDPTKGVEFIIENLLKLSSNKKWELRIAGKGSKQYESYLKNKYPNSNIEYLGFVQPQTFLPSVDVLLVSSLWHEPLPRTVFEAYSHGIPVVGSNRGGTPEIIDENETGYIYDPADPDSFVDIAESLVSNPGILSRLRLNCLEKARLFEPKQTLERYKNIYNKCIVINSFH